MRKPNRIFMIITVLVISLVSAQDVLHRLIVPLYFDASVSLGYDSNFLRFSPDEMDNADISGWILGDSPSFDSHIIKPELRLTYSPVFFPHRETRFKFRFSYSDYGQSDNKSYASVSALLEQHLGAYRRLIFGYSLSPNIFLRLYRDTDSISPDAQKCFFTSETVYASYSFPVFRKTWVRFKPRLNKQYFGPKFTEFDTDVWSVESRFYTRIIPDTRLSVWVISGKGDNISFSDGLVSTKADRSYALMSAGFSGTIYPGKTFDAVHFLFSTEYREYESINPLDHLHQGRDHWDYKTSFWIDRVISTDLSGQFRINYRVRKTDSQYDWVRSLKTFSKYEFWLKFTYNFSLDLFY